MREGCIKVDPRVSFRVRGELFRCFRLFLFISSLLLINTSFGGESLKSNVLVIHSYHEGLTWTDGENEGIKEIFKANGNVELAIEYMDAKRFPCEKVAPIFSDYLERKWEGRSWKAVIVSDNCALDFATYYREQLFPNAAICFCGINNFMPEMLEPFGGKVTGVIQQVDPTENIQLIRRLQPELRKLVVVSGTTPTAKAILSEVKSALKEVEPPFDVVWLEELETAVLESELKKLGPQDAVLLCNFNRDGKGVYYSHEDGARIVVRASGAPVYAMEDNYLGIGVVGGFMVSSRTQGHVAAELCLEVLSGESMPEVILTCPNTFMFDYTALSRFNLPLEKIPDSSVILNHPSSFYQLHKRLIWNTITLIALLAVAFVGVSFGLIRSRRAEAKLRDSRKNLSVTLNSIGDAVIATDTQGRVVSMNRVAESLTGWKKEDAIGKALPVVFNIINAQTREPQNNPVDEALESGEVVALSNHTILISKTGEEYQISDSSAPIRDDMDRIRGVVMVFRDVTEEYALQEQLRQSQKMDAIGQLAGGVAHDLNNMLGGIMGGTELLKQVIPAQDEAYEFLGIIEDSVKRAASLTGRLLAFARRQPTASTPVDVHRIILDTIALLKQTIDKRIKIESDLTANASSVVGDNAQLQNVFMNLGINASHAMPEGGRLSYSTRLTDLTEAQCRSDGRGLKAGTYLEIAVRDTGSGIPPECIHRIFEPFFTTKELKGTGLGLAAAHGTVAQHGGAITVYSELGKGTVFHVLLPLTEDAVLDLPVRDEPVYGEGTILLVDDEPVMRATGSALLKEYGYDVLIAENGAEAIDMFAEHRSEIDLVILDMIMPEMNGRDCFFELRKMEPELRVILSSGFSRVDDLEDMKKAGLAGFIQKPYAGADFSVMVANVLKRG